MTGERSDRDYDALLIVSFGGPERREDVRPFLENVLAGRHVPERRMREVAAHYYHFDGKSPINDQNRKLADAVRRELQQHGPILPVYLGNLHWHPMLVDTLRRMRNAGVRRAAAFVTSAFGSYASCRKYIDAVERARAELGEGAPVVHKLRNFYNHPGFIEAMVARLREAFTRIPEERRDDTRIAFTAHSIPLAMAEASEYEQELEEACRLVAEELHHDRWQLVFQSRSGSAAEHWLEPDILGHLRALSEIDVEDLLVAPIGFVSDHMEIAWDLDVEAKELADKLRVNMVRAGTVGTHPAFVSMIRELLLERAGAVEERRVVGTRGPAPAQCPPNCCRYDRGGAAPRTPPVAGSGGES